MTRTAGKSSNTKQGVAAQSNETDEQQLEKQQAFVSQGPYRYKIRNPNFEDDGTTTFFWRPHVVTSLVVVVAALVYMALFLDDEDAEVNTRRGVAAACGVFLVQAAMQFNDGPFVRPHPVVWRVVLGVSLLYEMGLLMVLFQKPNDGRQALKFIDPKLGERLPERTYAEDCTIYDPDHPSGNPFSNFVSKLDRFVIAHLLGWVVKTLAYRNVKILLVCSFAFELLEYMLEFQLPNFGECWWDHWILDFVVCNGGGIVIGLVLCRFLSMKTYRWRGIHAIPTATGKVMRAIAQFSPYAWSNFQWGPYKDLKHWLVTLLAIWMMLCADLNAFYLKTMLWIPAEHSFNVYRLLFAGCAAPVAVAEMNAYISDPDCNKLGHQAMLVTLILITEDLIIYKYWDNTPSLLEADMRWLVACGVLAGVLAGITINYAIKEVCHSRRHATGDATLKKLQ